MLTPKVAFKFGFLLRCAEEGLTSEQTTARVKQACQLTKQADPYTATLGALKQLGMIGLLGGAGVAAGGGALAGLGLANVTSGTVDADEIKNQELAATFSLLTDQLRTRNALRQMQASKPKPRAFHY